MWSFHSAQPAEAGKPALLLAFSPHRENEVVLKWMLTVIGCFPKMIIGVRQSGAHSPRSLHAKERSFPSG